MIKLMSHMKLMPHRINDMKLMPHRINDEINAPYN